MKERKKILIISNYPIVEPLHGGQKRVAAIVKEYKKVFSDVKFVAVFVREHYPIYSKDDIFLTGECANKVKDNYLTSDIGIADAMINCTEVREQIEKMLTSYRPDILQIEQTFPYMGLKTILNDLNIHPRLINSSHNIEAPMRKEIMERNGAEKKYIDESVSLINETEVFLAKNSDLTTVVSKENGEYLISKGAKKYVLAPNGINQPKPTLSAVNHWKKYFQKNLINQVALFIGSGHLPNVSSFKKMVGFRVGFIPVDTKIVIAGAVSESVKEIFDDSAILDSPFWKRAIGVGILSQDLLDGLINQSDVLLLPIVEGGGSNLKTAEAILSGKKIVATTFAFRGFEKYLRLPNIWIADSPEAFRESMVEALKATLKIRTDGETKLADKVQWQYALKEMVSEVAKL